jgi:hypothetical protein
VPRRIVPANGQVVHIHKLAKWSICVIYRWFTMNCIHMKVISRVSFRNPM